jgi:predicted RNA-binding protein (TIGR00451 family)
MSIDYLDLTKIKGISDYQFTPKITDILFEFKDNIKIEYSKSTKKIKYVYEDGNLLLSFKPTNGFFTLSLLAAKKILAKTDQPLMRVVVLNEISEFIKEGRNVFCKHVIEMDPNLRPLDEVIVVNKDDELLAVGRLMIPVPYIKAFDSGVAIKVRKGILKSKI